MAVATLREARGVCGLYADAAKNKVALVWGDEQERAGNQWCPDCGLQTAVVLTWKD
jgi:hypothetical protein